MKYRFRTGNKIEHSNQFQEWLPKFRKTTFHVYKNNSMSMIIKLKSKVLYKSTFLRIKNNSLVVITVYNVYNTKNCN